MAARRSPPVASHRWSLLTDGRIPKRSKRSPVAPPTDTPQLPNSPPRHGGAPEPPLTPPNPPLTLPQILEYSKMSSVGLPGAPAALTLARQPFLLPQLLSELLDMCAAAPAP